MFLPMNGELDILEVAVLQFGEMASTETRNRSIIRLCRVSLEAGDFGCGILLDSISFASRRGHRSSPMISLRPPQGFTGTSRSMTLLRLNKQGRLYVRTATGGGSTVERPALRDVLVLMDTSQGMAGEKITQAKQGVIDFACWAQPLGCATALAVYGNRAAMVCDPTLDPASLEKKIARLDAGIVGSGANLAAGLDFVKKVADPTAVILVMGTQPDAPANALAAGEQLRRRGFDILCVGADVVDVSFLVGLATRPDLALKVQAQDLRTSIGQAGRLLFIGSDATLAGPVPRSVRLSAYAAVAVFLLGCLLLYGILPLSRFGFSFDSGSSAAKTIAASDAIFSTSSWVCGLTNAHLFCSELTPRLARSLGTNVENEGLRDLPGVLPILFAGIGGYILFKRAKRSFSSQSARTLVIISAMACAMTVVYLWIWGFAADHDLSLTVSQFAKPATQAPGLLIWSKSLLVQIPLWIAAILALGKILADAWGHKLMALLLVACYGVFLGIEFLVFRPNQYSRYAILSWWPLLFSMALLMMAFGSLRLIFAKSGELK